MTLSQAIANRFTIDYTTEDTWISVLCPFHPDEDASAGVNFKLKLFNCFGCGVKKTFIHLSHDLKLTGYDLDHEDVTEVEDWLNNLIGETKPPIKKLKKQIQEYTDFLLEKKLKPETIEEFGGYFVCDITHPDYGHLVIPYGRNKYQKRRIIGRTESDRGFRNSAGKESGDSKSLFGRSISERNTIILCEGITDLLTLWQEGIKEVCCSFGASTSRNQMYLLRNKTVFILFDRDFSGHEGAKKAASQLKEFNAIPIILEIPERFGTEGEKIDINSAYCNSGSEFIAWVHSQISRYNVFDTQYITDIFLENKRTVKYVSSGIKTLDSALNGGFATGLHAIAGMPEAGKSSLVTYLAMQFIDNSNQKVLLLSYELTKEQMWSRVASTASQYSWSDIEKDHSIIEDNIKLGLKGASNYLRIENNWTIDQIKVAANNFDVIIVDYAQRMPFEGNDERAGIKNNCRELSNLTRDGKIIILISSIPRSMYDKTGKGVFKETGDIEFICQSGYILQKILPDVCKLSMIKNTRGICKDIYLKMDYPHQRISETIEPEVKNILE